MRSPRPSRRFAAGLAASLALGAALGIAGGCNHRVATPPPPRPEAPVWPEPPLAAELRLEGSFPGERFAPPAPSWGRRALDFLLGVEPEASGSDPAEALARPFGLCGLPDGFAVADPDGRKVLRVSWVSGRSELVPGPEGGWQVPMAVAASPAGVLFVADAGLGRVVRVGADGTAVPLGEAEVLERPSGLVVQGDELFVVDPPRHQVVVLSTEGHERRHFGGRGQGLGQLHYPTGIAAMRDGSLLVVDALNFRLSRFTPRGEPLGSFGRPGDGEGAFGRPKAVAVDDRGRLFVSDAQNDVVIVFSPVGHYLFAVGGSGAAPGRLSLPAGLAVGSGRLFVADSFNRRVQVFELLEGAP